MQIITIKDRVEQLHCDLLLAKAQKYPHQRIMVVNARADSIVAQYR